MRIRTDLPMIANGRLRQIGVPFISNKYGALAAVFQCECGNKTIVTLGNVKRHTTSCGCFSREQTSKRSIKHGQSSYNGKKASRLHNVWTAMIKRCYGKSNKGFRNYGGRGIEVCEEWRNSFLQFAADMGDPEDGMSIDRIDNNGNYEPKNCRWATQHQQSINRRTNRRLSHDGVTQTVGEWEKEKGYRKNLILSRLDRGWSVDKAIETLPITCGRR